MPITKNALIRYKTIDRCLRNRYRKWTLDDLVDACSNALYDMEGIEKGISTRTIQSDIQMMRSDKLGYYAPIEVYNNKFYRYADPDYSISNNPLTTEDYNLVLKAFSIIKKRNNENKMDELSTILSEIKDKLNILLKCE